jgi:hypothetical protein
MLYKFFGKPLLNIRSGETNMILFTFDTKGEYVTDDEKIIIRAKKKFDYIENNMVLEGERVKVYEPTPAIKIKINDITNIEPIAKDEPLKNRECKKCDFKCKTQGELLRHYRMHHSDKLNQKGGRIKTQSENNQVDEKGEQVK